MRQKDIFFRFTLSSFGLMAFSAQLNCLPADPAMLDKPVPFAQAFDYAQGVVDLRFRVSVRSGSSSGDCEFVLMIVAVRFARFALLARCRTRSGNWRSALALLVGR